MEEPKKSRGRPPHQPSAGDRTKVKVMAGLCIPDYDIAKVMQLSLPTLRLHYRLELEIGHIEQTAMVGQSLVKAALNGNVQAQRFYLQCRAGWIEARAPAGEQPAAGEETPGKKEAAQRASLGAEVGTAWAGLLAGPKSLN
jgi:hypothetical protein